MKKLLLATLTFSLTACATAPAARTTASIGDKAVSGYKITKTFKDQGQKMSILEQLEKFADRSEKNYRAYRMPNATPATMAAFGYSITQVHCVEEVGLGIEFDYAKYDSTRATESVIYSPVSGQDRGGFVRQTIDDYCK